jgi:CheY-like chemotaxis protein
MIELSDMRILIADDVDAMCKSIRNMLKILQFGKKFYFAYNGCQAWQILQKETVDLVIADLRMPEMDGMELLDHIRKDKMLRNLPVIMITNEATSEIVAEAAESDIDAYLLKPITVKMLDEKIRTVIDKANNPSPMDSHLKTARMFEEFGDLDMAIEEAELARQTDPLSSKPLRTLGYYYYCKYDFKTAEKYLLKASRINHLDVFAFHYLGQIYTQRNDIDKAVQFLEKAMEISPRNVYRAIDFAKLLVKKKKWRKARHIFKEVIERADLPDLLSEEIADFCLENKFYDYAALLLQNVLHKVPKRVDLKLKLGIVYDALKDFDNALKWLLEAENHYKSSIDIKLRIAKIYMLKKRPILADTYLKNILEIEPEHKEAKKLNIRNT